LFNSYAHGTGTGTIFYFWDFYPDLLCILPFVPGAIAPVNLLRRFRRHGSREDREEGVFLGEDGIWNMADFDRINGMDGMNLGSDFEPRRGGIFVVTNRTENKNPFRGGIVGCCRKASHLASLRHIHMTIAMTTRPPNIHGCWSIN
jgi:hypothetical protein